MSNGEKKNSEKKKDGGSGTPSGESSIGHIPDIGGIIYPDQKDNSFSEERFGAEGRKATPLRRSDIYPGMDDPIRKGTYSGSIIGQNPIFTPSGGYLPMGAIEKQRAAQDKADAARQQSIVEDQLNFEMGEPPSINDKRWQDEINNKFRSIYETYVNRAKNQHGAGWANAIKSSSTKVGREFQQELNNLETVAAMGNQTFDKIREIKKDLEKGREKKYSEETRKLVEEYERGLKRFSEGEAGVQNLAQKFNKLQTNLNLDTYVQDEVMDNISKDVRSFVKEAESVSGVRGVKQIRKMTTKKIDRVARNTARELKKDTFANDDDITEEDIYNKIMAFSENVVKEEIDRTVQEDDDYNAGSGDAPTMADVTPAYDKKMYGTGSKPQLKVGPDEKGWVDMKRKEDMVADVEVDVGSSNDESYSGTQVELLGTKDKEKAKQMSKDPELMMARVKKYQHVDGKDYMVVSTATPSRSGDADDLQKAHEKQQVISTLKRELRESGDDMSQEERQSKRRRLQNLQTIKQELMKGKERTTAWVDMEQNYATEIGRRPNKAAGYLQATYGSKDLSLHSKVKERFGIEDDTVKANEVVDKIEQSILQERGKEYESEDVRPLAWKRFMDIKKRRNAIKMVGSNEGE